jgi:outer membrane protein assembly factor BamB
MFNRKNLAFATIIIILVGACYLLFFKKIDSKHWLVYTTQPLGKKHEYGGDLFSFSGNLLSFNSQSRYSYSVNYKSGTLNWRLKTEGYSPFRPTILKGNLSIINGSDAIVYAVNKETGCEEWRFTNPNRTEPDTNVKTDQNDKYVFFGDRAGSLYALDKKTGEIGWETKFEQVDLSSVDWDLFPIHFGKLFQDDSYLYARISTQSELVKIDKKSGKIIWKTEVPYDHQPLIFNHDVILVLNNSQVIAINKTTGEKKWSKQQIVSQPKKSHIYKGRVFLVSQRKNLAAININNGQTIWQKDFSGQIKPKIEIEKKHLYLTHYIRGNQNVITKINADNGQEVWQKKLEYDITAINIPTEHKDYILFGTDTGHLLVLKKDSGAIHENIYVRGRIRQIRRLDQGYVINSISDGWHVIITKFDHNFEKKWQFESPFKIAENSFNFYNNRLFFTDQDRQLITSINLKTDSKPNYNDFKKVNFDLISESDFTKLWNYLKANLPNTNNKVDRKLKYLRYKQKEISLTKKLKSLITKVVYTKQKVKKNRFKVKENYDGTIVELTLTHQHNQLGQPINNLWQNPLKVKAKFTNPSNDETVVGGFVYQKNTWKVRFRPDEVGKWEYKLKLITPFPFKNHSYSGYFNIEQESEKKFITLNPGKPLNFFLENGQIFHPIGLQDVILDFNYDGNPINQWGLSSAQEQVKSIQEVEFATLEHYLKPYSKNGFNFYRWGVGNVSFKLSEELNSNKEIDLLHAKFGDELVKELNSQDFHIMMTLFGFHPPFPYSIENKNHKKIIENYLNHVVARYGSLVDIWELCNEAEVSNDWINFVVQHLQSIDPYNHPISTNWNKPANKNIDLLSIHWHESEKIINSDMATYSKIKRLKNFNKPIVFSEVGNKNASWSPESPERMRLKLWTSFFNQAYLVFWNSSRDVFENPDYANTYLGPTERRYTQIFTTETRKISDNIKPFKVESQNEQLRIYGLTDENYQYLYLVKDPDFYNRAQIELPFSNKNITWIDTKTGDIIKTDQIDPNGQVSLPNVELDVFAKIN